MADLRGWSAFAGIQIRYNLIDRTAERELLPMAKAFDIGVTAWSPLAGGVLTGKYSQEKNEPKRYEPDGPFGKSMLTPENLSIANNVLQVAEQIGKSPSQLALRWLLQQNDRGVIIPIIGARNLPQLEDNLGCLDFEIEDRHMEQLDSISRIELGFPHDFLSADMVRSTIYGETYALIDNHRKN